MAQRLPDGYVFDPADPRSPSEAQWAAMTPAERAKVVDMLPVDDGLAKKQEAVRKAEDRARLAQKDASRAADRIAELERRLREAEEKIEQLERDRA